MSKTIYPNLREWLVRTRHGLILGPFTPDELLRSFESHSFAQEDEIAQSCKPWMLAHVLSFRDEEESTNTSAQDSTTATTQSSPTESLSESLVPQSDLGEGTREAKPLPVDAPLSPQLPPPQTEALSLSKGNPRFSAGHKIYAAVSVATLILGLFFVFLKPSKKSPSSFENQSASLSGEMGTFPWENERVRAVLPLVQRRMIKEALAQLTADKNVTNHDREVEMMQSALWLWEGQSILQAERYLRAIAQSKEASILQKAFAEMWLGYKALKHQEGDYGEAHFLQALEYVPRLTMAKFNLARAYLIQKKPELASQYLWITSKETPHSWLIELCKGDVESELRNGDSSLAYESALALAPDRWQVNVTTAHYLYEAGDTKKAEHIMSDMLMRDPDFERDDPLPLGYAWPEPSYDSYAEDVMRILPEDSALFSVAKHYLAFLQNKNQARALSEMDHLVQKRDSNQAKILLLRMHLVSHELPPTASLRHLVSTLPSDLSSYSAYAYAVRALAWNVLGNKASAQQDLDSALELDPKCASCRMAFSQLLAQWGHAEESREQRSQLLRDFPHYLPALVPLMEKDDPSDSTREHERP